MKNDFVGKTVLISGGSSGIGQRMCLDFAKSGADIAFLYNLNDAGAEETYKQVMEHGVNCYKYKASVQDYEEIKNVVEDLIKKTGKIDVLINNAGVLKVGPLAGMHHDEWKDVIDINLNGAFRLTKCCLPYLLKGKGIIINISSYMAFKPNGSGQAVYSATKAALIGLTRELSNELGRISIRVNAIAPGLIDTVMTDKLPKKTRDGLVASTSLKRMGRVEEISSMAYYLASDEAKFITGQTFIVDGGSVKGTF